MTKAMVDTFVRLGEQLDRFGRNAETRQIVAEAERENPWFRPREIERAVRAIREQMLRREALTNWLAAYPALPAKRPADVLIVMAGNIPLVGFSDLLCVLAAGHRAAISPSSKDRILVRYIARQLLLIDPSLPLERASETTRPDAVIAMGGDAAVRALHSRYAGLPMLLRGSRSSVAVLQGDETDADLDGLTDDILSYSGLGCRNVSFLLAPSRYDFTRLSAHLSRRQDIHPKHRHNYLQQKALLTLNGDTFIDTGSVLLVEEEDFPSAVSRLHYRFYSSSREVATWLHDHDKELQCVAGPCDHPRRVGFGQTQMPSLTDYPDGRDTMEFLSAL